MQEQGWNECEGNLINERVKLFSLRSLMMEKMILENYVWVADDEIRVDILLIGN